MGVQTADPDEEEIRRQCELIREGWTRGERRRRRMAEVPPVEVTRVNFDERDRREA